MALCLGFFKDSCTFDEANTKECEIPMVRNTRTEFKESLTTALVLVLQWGTEDLQFLVMPPETWVCAYAKWTGQ